MVKGTVEGVRMSEEDGVMNGVVVAAVKAAARGVVDGQRLALRTHTV